MTGLIVCWSCGSPSTPPPPTLTHTHTTTTNPAATHTHHQGWVQSYGSRYVRPPIIHGDVAFTRPMTVREYAVAQQLTVKPVKGMLTGGWCGGRERGRGAGD
jgi:hypothetical protein